MNLAFIAWVPAVDIRFNNLALLETAKSFHAARSESGLLSVLIDVI